MGPWIPCGGPRGPRAAWVGALGLLTACHFETAGLEALADQDSSYVTFPGERLLDGGQYRWPWIDGKGGKEDAYLSVFDEGDTLSLVSLGTGAACEVGNVARVRSFRSLGGEPLWKERPPRMAVLENLAADGHGALSFVAPDCSRWKTGLEHSELPSMATQEEFVVRERVGETDDLFAVDPWRRKKRRILSSVEEIANDLPNGLLWTRTTEGLVVFDSALHEVGRMEQVDDFMLIDADRAAIMREGALYLLDDIATGKLRLVADDACHLGPAGPGSGSGWSGTGQPFISYIGPCATGEIRLYDVEGNTTYRVNGPIGTSPFRVVVSITSLQFYVVVDSSIEWGPGTDYSAPEAGTLWGGRLSPEDDSTITAEVVGENALVSITSLYYNQFEPKIRVLVDRDGQLGRLVEWQPGQEAPKPLAQKVRETSGDLALANYDGEVGDLMTLLGSTPELLASGVSGLGAVSWSTSDVGQALAVVAEGDRDTGRLFTYYVEGEDAQVLNASPRLVAKQVVVDQMEIFPGVPAVGYLRQFDPDSGTGILGLYFVNSNDGFEQAGVSEWQPTTWPEVGILYVVPNGKSAGVWFARVK